MFKTILMIILFLTFYSFVDFIRYRRTDIIDNLSFIIPWVLIKYLFNIFYPTEWIGHLVGLIGSGLLYQFLFIPYFLKRNLKNNNKGISKGSTLGTDTYSAFKPKTCITDPQYNFMSHDSMSVSETFGPAIGARAMDKLWPPHMRYEKHIPYSKERLDSGNIAECNTPFKKACNLMEELHKTSNRASSLKEILKKHLIENKISRNSVKEYLSKQKKKDGKLNG